jgi:hypothetical protein
MKLHIMYGTAVLLLLGVIAVLMYQRIDTAINLSKQDMVVVDLESANRQLIAAIPVLARDVSKENIVSSMKLYRNDSSYEKHGCVWVGNVVLKFSPEQKLDNVSLSLSYGEPVPCFAN